jgi:1-acyl-sn-glycerol-3-phosphate acyltransferase
MSSIARRLLEELFGHPLDPDELRDLDPDLARVLMPTLDLLRRYLRAEVRGLEKLPEGPALLVGNHNGGITFLEPLLLGKAWYDKTGGRMDIHALGHETLFKIPGLGNFIALLGTVSASHENAAQVFASGQKVWVFPGGNYEAFRPWTERHRVDFGGHSGFVKLALHQGVPIVPVLSFGGHEAFFVLTRGESLARLAGTDRLLRSRAFPIFLGLPWGIGVGPIFHLPLPVRCVVEVGEPIVLSEFSPDDADDDEIVRVLYTRVQNTLQRMMDEVVAERRWSQAFPALGR